MARGNFLRTLRISLLAYLLLMVALGAWLARKRSTDWNGTLYVAVYPANADGSERSGRYIERLQPGSFDAIERFVAREAARYGIALFVPIEIELGAPVSELPPPPPASRNPLAVMAWSLRFRYYAYREQSRQDMPAPDVRLFVQYFDPDRHERLDHSIGLEKGLVGIVNAFARRDLAPENSFIIAHELFHTLGATDKYDRGTTLPLYPDGYSDPHRRPLYPQTEAEIMGGRVPLNEQQARMPESLSEALVGPATAREIGWRDRGSAAGSP